MVSDDHGDTRFSAPAYRRGLMWLLCSFQGPWRGETPAGEGFLGRDLDRDTPTPDGRRSLKTQQHAGVVDGLAAAVLQVDRRTLGRRGRSSQVRSTC